MLQSLARMPFITAIFAEGCRIGLSARERLHLRDPAVGVWGVQVFGYLRCPGVWVSRCLVCGRPSAEMSGCVKSAPSPGARTETTGGHNQHAALLGNQLDSVTTHSLCVCRTTLYRPRVLFEASYFGTTNFCYIN